MACGRYAQGGVLEELDEDGDELVATDGGLTPLMFHTLLLSSANRAVCPTKADEVPQPAARSLDTPPQLEALTRRHRRS